MDYPRAASAHSRPRVIIVGAGMSGLSAARRILSSSPRCYFELTILEASQRIGGRIRSSVFGGERVEMGATWIHGIEGSPVYKIAEKIGALQSEIPWECMDGFPETPVVKAEGGLEIHPTIVHSVGSLYKRLYSLIQHTDRGLQQYSFEELDSSEYEEYAGKSRQARSVGAYLKEGLERFLAAQENGSPNGTLNKHVRTIAIHESVGRPMWKSSPNQSAKTRLKWSVRSLQEGVFAMRENLERSVTGANAMSDLDLESNDEYWEYPGEHETIAKGYASVVKVLATEIDVAGGRIRLGKRVRKIKWLNSKSRSGGAPVRIRCEDGSVFEADHVIVTVSLGVLKAEAVAKRRDRRLIGKHLNDTATEDQAEEDDDEAKEDEEEEEEERNLFEPPLPDWKTDAIVRMGFGVVDKLFLHMNKSQAGATYPHMQLVFHPTTGEPATEGGDGDLPWWMRRNFSFYPINRASSVVCTWLTGEEALETEKLSNKEVMEGVVRSMAAFGYKERGSSCGGGCVAEAREICRSRWGVNPLFRGSYSYVAVGSSGEDFDALAEPLPRPRAAAASSPSPSEPPPSASASHRSSNSSSPPPLQLLFAGEATHRYCYSTTHGAFLSGLREADRLLSLYALRPNSSTF